MTNRRIALLALIGVAAFTVAGCSDDDSTGSVSVLLESEDTILSGLDAGTEGEQIQDGWNVRFDSFIISVGDVAMTFSNNESTTADAHDVFVIDLTDVPANGIALWDLNDLRVGRWEFGYAVEAATADAIQDPSVSKEDYNRMVDEDLSYLIRGTLTQTGGESCPPEASTTTNQTPNGNVGPDGDACYDNASVEFELAVPVDTVYGPCEIDEVPGVSVTEGTPRTVAASIHGDHIFFNGFPEGDESGVTRLAQWLADSDLNVDGTVEEQELRNLAPSDLAELDPAVYALGGSPIQPLENMWDYVQAQLKTQGHFQGEGECAIDGVEHHHDDDEDEHDDDEDKHDEDE
ncbi:MAG: hypothetical protein AAF355_07660 [Myxococcota bacterium]